MAPHLLLMTPPTNGNLGYLSTKQWYLPRTVILFEASRAIKGNYIVNVILMRIYKRRRHLTFPRVFQPFNYCWSHGAMFRIFLVIAIKRTMSSKWANSKREDLLGSIDCHTATILRKINSTLLFLCRESPFITDTTLRENLCSSLIMRHFK